ncbi:MAG TPA: alpha-(1-_3)-arabinofuranosyltransferase [Pseudonocardiaceae bacterium]|jgi:arabinofuranan 3-O-arabinosyltransferase
MAARAERTDPAGEAADSGALTERPTRPRPATVAVVVVLTALSFAQRPGRITFDTKLDLALAPSAFLARALHLWNPEATFGELQNQAYGYLFPVGPFFVATQALHIPTWVAQRLWCALLLCGAFLGALLLARALSIGKEPARYLGALSYALAPRVLTEIGPLSVEMLPAVLLPWVLLPLVRVRRLRSPRRAAAMSGLAVFAMGGTNAAMVLMALTLPGIWLLTRQWTADHVRLVGWWCVSVLAATLWWIVPLLLLAGYSLPFLNYIESAANTTAPLSLFQVLRGTNQWIAYVVQGEPWWPAGFLLVDNPVLMAATALVAGIGLLGLAGRGLPERTFLLLGMLTGLVLLTVGHVGPLDSPVAEQVQRLLDGPLAALRNVHKFDPVLRLTLAMGFVHAVSRPAPGLGVSWRRARLAVAALLVITVAAPAWQLALRPGQGWTAVPAYWREAAAWLAAKDGTSRTLMLPATGFGEYRWGRTVDEPLQALADSPWAVRGQVPLGSEGNTRFMDAVSDAVSDGRGSPALADFLARAGVRFLLLRNDVDRSSLTMPPVAVMHQALARSPGISPAATFGPRGPAALDPRQLSAVDRDVGHPALEVYEVDRTVRLATVASAADVVTVSGGPESVLPLLEQGLLRPDQPTVLAGDATAANADSWVLTDGLRRRERNVGRVQGNVSQTLADTDPVRQVRPALDVLPFAGAEHQTVARYAGVRAVLASTAAGYADAFGESDPSQAPFAAVDGDPASMWRSSSFTGPVGQWLEVQLDTPRVFDHVTVDFAQDLRIGWPVSRIRISTDRGSVEHDVPEPPGPHDYPVFGGPSARVRVTVLGMRGGREDGNVAVRELVIPGVAASRALRVPADVRSSRPPVLAFSRGSQPRGACFADGDGLRCDGGLVRVGEEPLGVDRRFRLSMAGLYVLTGTAMARLGPQPWLAPSGLAVSASSQLGADPAVSVRMAFDGDPGTGWVAELTDPAPTITLRWPGPRTVDRLSWQPSMLNAANPPLAIELHALDAGGADQVRRVDVAAGATSASFGPLVTDNLRIGLQSADQLPLAVDGRPGSASVGLAELRVPALDDLLPAPATPPAPAGAGCGFGPPIEVDGKRYDTAVFGSQADATGLQRLRLLPCGSLEEDGLALQPGDHRVRALPTGAFVVHDLTLTPLIPALPPAPQQRALQVLSWRTTHRAVQLGDGPDSYLFVPENANNGWVARLDGRALGRARVDGWQQAWLIPAGAGGVISLDFVPDRPYRTALLVGGLLVLALVLAALLPAWRRRRPPPSPVPSSSWWGPAIAVLALLLLLAGPAALVALLACLLLRRLWSRALPAVLATAVLAATTVAVAGRVLGHGQDWAFGTWSQAAILVAVAAAVAAFLYPPMTDQERS